MRRMADPTNEKDMAIINAEVPRALRETLDRARVVDGIPRYKLAEVVRIVLARAIDANMHLRLDAGEEGQS